MTSHHRLNIRIKTHSSIDQIVGTDESGKLIIRVKAVPIENAANLSIIRILAKASGVPKSKLRIIHGHKSRDKIIEIECDTSAIDKLNQSI